MMYEWEMNDRWLNETMTNERRIDVSYDVSYEWWWLDRCVNDVWHDRS